MYGSRSSKRGAAADQPCDATVKRVAIVQSCYIPWKGYFDVINSVDEFILYDDRQYTRRDWRNRNRIKTPQGPRWLTIPVKVRGRYHQRIDETEVSDPRWPVAHWHTLEQNYARAAYFDEYRDTLEQLYVETEERRLSAVNRRFLDALCALLGISTPLVPSTEYEVEGDRTERLVALCQAAGATHYLTGPSARDYLDERLFDSAGIALEYADYTGYPEYQQLFPPFDHEVTLLDLILSTGPEAQRYMKSFSTQEVAGGL
jgi:hypothetical protein